MFTTFAETARAMTAYQPPSPAQATAFLGGRNAVASMWGKLQIPVWGHRNVGQPPDFKAVAQAVDDFIEMVAPFLPVATPDCTALARQLNIVRMTATRAMGGANALDGSVYQDALAGQVALLDVALAAAIFSQPAVIVEPGAEAVNTGRRARVPRG